MVCAGETAANLHSASHLYLCQRGPRCRQAHTRRMFAMQFAFCSTAVLFLCKQLLHHMPSQAGPAYPAGLVARSTPKARRNAARSTGCTSASCAPAAPPAAPATGGMRTSTWAQQCSCRLTGEQAVSCKQGNVHIYSLHHTSALTSCQASASSAPADIGRLLCQALHWKVSKSSLADPLIHNPLSHSLMP